jgi:hypothetical protein
MPGGAPTGHGGLIHRFLLSIYLYIKTIRETLILGFEKPENEPFMSPR